MSERIRCSYDDALYKSTHTLLYFTDMGWFVNDGNSTVHNVESIIIGKRLRQQQQQQQRRRWLRQQWQAVVCLPTWLFLFAPLVRGRQGALPARLRRRVEAVRQIEPLWGFVELRRRRRLRLVQTQAARFALSELWPFRRQTVLVMRNWPRLSTSQDVSGSPACIRTPISIHDFLAIIEKNLMCFNSMLNFYAMVNLRHSSWCKLYYTAVNFIESTIHCNTWLALRPLMVSL